MPPVDSGADTAVDSATDSAVDSSDAGPDGGDSAVDASDAGDAAIPERIDDLLRLLEDPSSSAEDVDAALETVALEASWPLVEGGRILFATRWDDAPPDVAMVSDLNDWDDTAHRANRAATGVHYWALFDTTGLARPLAGALYKWWGSPDVFRPPPEATVYGFDALGEHGIVAPDWATQHRQRFPLRSSHLDLPRTIRFLVPAGFSAGSSAASDARVLLMHDGQNLFHPDAVWGGWRVDEALAADAGLADVVVVAVDNADDRFDAYTHVADDFGSGTVGGRADDYLALLSDEALPFARARFGLSAAKSQTVVAGSSLGGLVSLVLAIEAPEVATCVIAMSPTLGWGAFDPALDGSAALARRWPVEVGHGDVAIYLDGGGTVTGACIDTDGDGIQEDSDDSDNLCTTMQLRDVLDAEGYTFDMDLFHWHEPGAPHNEAAWAARFPMALDACEAAGW